MNVLLRKSLLICTICKSNFLLHNYRESFSNILPVNLSEMQLKPHLVMLVLGHGKNNFVLTLNLFHYMDVNLSNVFAVLKRARLIFAWSYSSKLCTLCPDFIVVSYNSNLYLLINYCRQNMTRTVLTFWWICFIIYLQLDNSMLFGILALVQVIRYESKRSLFNT